MESFDLIKTVFSKYNKSIQKIHNDILAPYHLSSLHSMYIILLFKNKDGLTQKQLSEQLFVDKSNTSRAINDLLDKEYAYKEETADERNVKIYLSKIGSSIAEKMLEETRKSRAKITNILTNEEKLVLKNILEKINDLEL